MQLVSLCYPCLSQTFFWQIYKADGPRPECFCACSSNKEDEFPAEFNGANGPFKLIRHVSFVDCPGHDILMATMLNGAAVMDAALLLIGRKFALWFSATWACEVCLVIKSRKIALALVFKYVISFINN